MDNLLHAIGLILTGSVEGQDPDTISTEEPESTGNRGKPSSKRSRANQPLERRVFSQNLNLTGRDCGQEERAPMCGVPYHSSESYVARLVKKGYKVAICEQVGFSAGCPGFPPRGWQ